MNIKCDNDKYEWIFDEVRGKLTCKRNGEPWRDETGDGAILALMQLVSDLQDKPAASCGSCIYIDGGVCPTAGEVSSDYCCDEFEPKLDSCTWTKVSGEAFANTECKFLPLIGMDTMKKFNENMRYNFCPYCGGKFRLLDKSSVKG